MKVEEPPFHLRQNEHYVVLPSQKGWVLSTWVDEQVGGRIDEYVGGTIF